MLFNVWFAIATTAMMPMHVAVSAYTPTPRVEHIAPAVERVTEAAPKAKRTRKPRVAQPVMSLGWADEDEVAHF